MIKLGDKQRKNGANGKGAKWADKLTFTGSRKI